MLANTAGLVFIFFGVVSLFAVAIGIAWHFHAEKKRTEAMRNAAVQQGLPFFDKGDPSLINELSHFQLFSQGRSRKIKNIVHGNTAEGEVGIFDYQYASGGRNSTTFRQSVIYIQSAELNLPPFAMRPEDLFDRLGGYLGFQDIDFETHPNFSKIYLLKGQNEEATRQLFQEPILAHFESVKGINLEGSGVRFIYFRADTRIKPEELESFLQEGFHLYSLLRTTATR